MEKLLPPSTEIMLYRILQELLNNILKHAEATHVIVQFNRHAEKLSVVVEDNGKGFNTSVTTQGNAAGLETIKTRVHYLSGELNIDSKLGVGTTVMMEFRLRS